MLTQPKHKRYAIIGFMLDTTINHDGSPVRSVTFIQDTDDADEALRTGLAWEGDMETHRGTQFEYDEVQVIDTQETI